MHKRTDFPSHAKSGRWLSRIYNKWNTKDLDLTTPPQINYKREYWVVSHQHHLSLCGINTNEESQECFCWDALCEWSSRVEGEVWARLRPTYFSSYLMFVRCLSSYYFIWNFFVSKMILSSRNPQSLRQSYDFFQITNILLRQSCCHSAEVLVM
jgi:hypothetical protein